ncbi:MAG: serine hydrolase domain-containing protein [Bacteroidota bacterium]
MKKIVLLLVLSLSASGFLQSQNFNKAKMDSLFDAIDAHQKAMCSITISKNGKVVYARAIGSSVIDGKQKTPATINTEYRIGSITKMFTTTIIFQLIEEGKLSLATHLSDFFPKLPNADKITIENLLYHRSGLHNFTDDSLYLTWNTQPKTESEMLDIIGSHAPDFQPNEKTAYSNSNFVVLGYIIEKICGNSYSDILKQRITSKIGLTQTYCGGKTDFKKGEALSYNFEKDIWTQEAETDMSIPGGAGCIVSTPTDLCKFIDALFTGKLVRAKSLKQMETIKDGMGAGMFKFPFYEKTAYGHTGGIDAFQSELTYFPIDSVSVAFCGNGMAMPMNDIAIGFMSIYYNKSYSIPEFKTVTLTEKDLEKYLGNYSSEQMPLKIIISKDGNALMAQASGQSAFPLEATEINVFEFQQAGIVMEFHPEKNEFTLKQAGGKYLFVKDK